MTKKPRKQLEILQYIYEKQLTSGYPPTIREIGAKVGLASSSTVHGHLDRLQKKGLIIKDAEKTRAIKVTPQGISLLNQTYHNDKTNGLVTDIATDNLFSFDEYTFILQQHSNTMLNIGILNNDYLIVKKQKSVVNGDIVVVKINEITNVYRYFKEGTHCRLQPENSNLKPVIIENPTILGCVVGIYRNHIN
ncbi:transcriptional repressor LexA [Weissella paramesenteroides]|jgi:repressor LexA|uniref:transcriptional repressor LexA n=1 Tax=Weissella paramesenteroides TaxID=1249 RepID=UPI0038908E29